MNEAKSIGQDVHQATISVSVMDFSGKLVMEAMLETKTETILQLVHGLRGSLHVTLEEGTYAICLHDVLKPHVREVLVCDPRKNALCKSDNKNDRIVARKPADLLRTGLLSPVYHGEHGIRPLKELAPSYTAITHDLTRVMVRLKAIYRSWARTSSREQKHSRTRLLRQIPAIGPICAALLIALMQTPHRFRTKRQLRAYSGPALKTYTSREYRFVGGQLKHSKKVLAIRGLNINHNHDLKNIFKGAATRAAVTPGPF